MPITRLETALTQCRMMEESGSFSSLDEYKRIQGIAWLYNETGKSKGEIIREYAQKEGCSEETAKRYLTVARLNRSQVSLYVTAQDEDWRGNRRGGDKGQFLGLYGDPLERRSGRSDSSRL